jgi:hypothetical protein
MMTTATSPRPKLTTMMGARATMGMVCEAMT